MIPTMIAGKHINSFCGPFAISAMTGIRIDEVVIAFKDLRQKREETTAMSYGYRKKRSTGIRGVYNHEMIDILKGFGYGAKKIDGLKRDLSLKRFVETEGAKVKNVPILVNVTGHYVVLFNGIMTDTSHKIPTAFQFVKKYRRSRVVSAWVVERSGLTQPPAPM